MRCGVALKIAGVGSSSERGGVSGRSCRGGASALPSTSVRQSLGRRGGTGMEQVFVKAAAATLCWGDGGVLLAAAQGRPPHPHLDHRGGGHHLNSSSSTVHLLGLRSAGEFVPLLLADPLSVPPRRPVRRAPPQLTSHQCTVGPRNPLSVHSRASATPLPVHRGPGSLLAVHRVASLAPRPLSNCCCCLHLLMVIRVGERPASVTCVHWCRDVPDEA